MVRVRRVELLSQPWEGHIIAVIRYPLALVPPKQLPIIDSLFFNELTMVAAYRNFKCVRKSEFISVFVRPLMEKEQPEFFRTPRVEKKPKVLS
jgi:hypothetical protein